MVAIITGNGHKEIPVSQTVVDELTNRLMREDVVRRDMQMMRCVEEAKWQAEERKWAAPTRFRCSVPLSVFIQGLQKDPYYWHDKKILKRWVSEHSKMTGD